jgi:hypothetical protein
MPQREFDITIGKDGSVELHVKGFLMEEGRIKTDQYG